MSELKQAMKDNIPVIKPSKKPVKVRPAGFKPDDDRVFNYDKRHNVWTRINLDKYPTPPQKGVY